LWKKAYLVALAHTGNNTESARIAGVNRGTAERLRKANATFHQECDAALDCYQDRLQAAFVSRGVDGVPRKKFTNRGEPIIDQETGKQYVEVEYSDQLLIEEARAAHPNRYRRSNDIHITDDRPSTGEELYAELSALIAEAKGLKDSQPEVPETRRSLARA